MRRNGSASTSGNDLTYPVQALWEIYILSGADTDGDKGPGALIAGMGVEGFARVVVDEVRDLRERYDEALNEAG